MGRWYTISVGDRIFNWKAGLIFTAVHEIFGDVRGPDFLIETPLEMLDCDLLIEDRAKAIHKALTDKISSLPIVSPKKVRAKTPRKFNLTPKKGE